MTRTPFRTLALMVGIVVGGTVLAVVVAWVQIIFWGIDS